jgi:UDP-3-O-[3-hydroxymyristoyl] glucosamine N-acyltransferase
MGTTIVRQGVKLDNLVQIAHNVEVGAHTVMSAQVGVAGHLQLPDGMQAGAQAGIHTARTEGAPVMGTPAINAKQFALSSAVFKQLPDMRREMLAMRKEIDELKAQLGR